MKPRALIADDSLTVRMDLDEAFRAAGFDVMLCATLGSVREAIARDLCDVLVLDILFPDGDGIDLLEELRASPQTEGLPVILLSSQSAVASRIRGIHAGAHDFAGKPYDADFVVARSKELIGDRDGVKESDDRPRILAIDDSATFLNELRESLEGAGYRVVEAPSGEEGLREAARCRPDAIVVDGMLPDIDGAAVVRRLRQDPALRGTPCILLTASSDAAQEIEALQSGLDVYMRKDQGMSVLLARVGALLRSGHSTPAKSAQASLFEPKRILAIDDSETFLQELAAELQDDGYDVVLARSGEEALELLAVQSVDCILVDLIMPGISGQETCRRIKASPEWRDIPVLMLTAREDREAMIDGINAGADDYIAKSSDFDVVRARLQAQLRRKHFEIENRLIRDDLHHREMEAAREIQRMLEERASALELANRYKSEFLANMSHELRTPLNSMLLISKLLADNAKRNLSGEQVTWAKTIHSSGSELLVLINDILDLSKVDAGRMTLCVDDVDLREIATSLERTFGCVAKGKGLSFHVDVAAELPEAIRTDRQRLLQILNNLVSNALKFTDAGEVRVRLVRPEDGEGLSERDSGAIPTIAVVVSDTGIGIAEDKQQVIFETFRQEDGTTTRKYGGTGLGLAIASKLAALLGGEIRVRSRKGEGSAFTLVLPERVEAQPPTDETSAARSAVGEARVTVEGLPTVSPVRGAAETIGALVDAEGVDVTVTGAARLPEALSEDLGASRDGDEPLRGKRVLLVDDEVRSLFALAKTLEERGLGVELERDASAALRHLEGQGHLDLVVIDAAMPEVEGRAIIRGIRERSLGRRLPIIAVTTTADSAATERLLESGASECVSRPIDPQQLLLVLRRCLDAR